MTDLYTRIDSPVGDLHATASGSHLTGLYVANHSFVEFLSGRDQTDAPVFDLLRGQLEDYWNGTLQEFTVPLAPRGSYWQKLVWAELIKVPFGETVSYLELGRRVGRPRAARAVGSANARNRISILIPCHRVIGASGKLTGYAGGTDRKRWLLDHETTGKQAKGTHDSRRKAEMRG